MSCYWFTDAVSCLFTCLSLRFTHSIEWSCCNVLSEKRRKNVAGKRRTTCGVWRTVSLCWKTRTRRWSVNSSHWRSCTVRKSRHRASDGLRLLFLLAAVLLWWTHSRGIITCWCHDWDVIISGCLPWQSVVIVIGWTVKGLRLVYHTLVQSCLFISTTCCFFANVVQRQLWNIIILIWYNTMYKYLHVIGC